MAATAQRAPAREILALADGVELIGEYEDSGFKEPPLLARRADGQMIQLTRLLYLVAAASDGRRDVREVAAAVSERFGRPVSARNVRFIADERLRPLGVLALRDGTTPELPKREAMFALRCRRPIVPERAVNAIARMLTWLHWPALKLILLLALAALDFWLFAVHGIAPALRSVIYDPTLLLAVLASTVVATAWHECGHASACRYGGARPGVIGVGLYLVWPAFYCDVTEAYRLGRTGRLRTDLGGVYFNGIFALAAGAGYFATGQEAFLLVVFVQHTVILQQLLPLMRFDGYYVLSDLTGVPDILSRIRPIFRSLVPWRRNDPLVEALKPWVRVVVTLYLLALVPTLIVLFAWTVVSVPRVAATVHDSLGLQLDRIVTAPGLSETALAVVRLAALVLPAAAISISLSRAGRMGLRGLAGWSRGSLPRRTVVVTALAALAVALIATWWPNGDYEPIRPGERGTVMEAMGAIPDYLEGRPSFTEETERRSGPVQTERERAAEARDGTAAPTPTPETGRETPTPAERDEPPSGDEDATPDTSADESDDPSDDPSDDSSDDSSSPTDTPEPTATAPAAGTETPSPPAADTPAPTPSAEPTATSTPTAAPTSTPTPDATSTTTPDATSTATPDAAMPATPEPSSTAPSTSPAAAADTPIPTSTPTP